MTDETPTSDDAGFSSTDDPMDQFLDEADDTIDADVDHEKFKTEDGSIDFVALDAADPDELTKAEKALLKAEKRRAILEHFILASPMLREDPERRGAFLLGGLIAQLSNYQQMKDRGSTLADAFPPSAITPEVAERAHTEAIEKAHAYKKQQHATSLMYREYYKPLTEAFAKAAPETWEARLSQLQFYYGLGISYGESASFGLDEVDLEVLYAEIERLRSEDDAEGGQETEIASGTGIAY